MSTIDNRPVRNCALDGCNKLASRYSRWCRYHASRVHRTRSAYGRTFRVTELAPFRKQADAFLTLQAEHPATVAALGFIERQLSPSPHETTAARHKVALEAHMRRLWSEGVTPREVLLRFLTVAGRITENSLAEIARDHPCAMFNIGRLVLRSARLPQKAGSTGRRETVKLDAAVCETLGQRLMDALGGYQVAAWHSIRAGRDAKATTAAEVRDALTATPFGNGPL